MISYYKTVEDRIAKIDKYEEGCWINCISPDEDEVNYLLAEFNIEPDFVRASLDDEETSHIEREDDSILIIIDTPIVNKLGKNLTYSTRPLSIIITPKNVITISLKENSIVEEFSEGLMRKARPEQKIQFILHIMLRTASKYLQYLKQIDKITGHVEEELKKSMKNKELVQLMEIEKSLVYFSASLKSIKTMLAKITRGKYIKLEDENQEVLEDLSIEIQQATEMSEIYLSILSGTMNAFASIISNNLNIVMKVLASITIILSIPTLVAGIYGMNNGGLYAMFEYVPVTAEWWFPFAASGALMAAAWFLLKRKNMM